LIVVEYLHAVVVLLATVTWNYINIVKYSSSNRHSSQHHMTAVIIVALGVGCR